MDKNRWDHPGWGFKAKTKEELERTHRIVNTTKHAGYELAWTVSRFRSHEDYLTVVKQAGGSVEE